MMYPFRHIRWGLIGAICLILLAAGCESDSDNDAATNAPSSSEQSLIPLVVSPVTVNFSAQLVTNISFSATGGQGAYAWSIANNTLGSLVSAGASAIYTSVASAGQNTLTLSDGGGNTVTATINQN